MKITVLTLFPELIMNTVGTSIMGRAIEKGIVSVNAVNIRDFTLDKNKRVDDYTYGGGAGMLMQAQPVYDAFKSLNCSCPVIFMTPTGKVFKQEDAEALSGYGELVFLCGHYEGIDQRVLDKIVTHYYSIGDYVLTGGELPACVCMDAITRLLPGVLGNHESADIESFYNGLLEYPQYSRPEVWENVAVPEILLSGNHKLIDMWRLEKSLEITRERRPGLYGEWVKNNPDYFTEKAIKKRKVLEKYI